MPVTIVTDSTCDLYPQVVEQKNITVVPLRVQVDTKSYIDGVNINTEQLYDFITEGHKLPTTSQPPVQDFIDTYSKIKGDILSIHIASSLSGTANVANQAKQMLGDDGRRIRIYDSRNLTLGMGLLVLAAKEQADLGKSTDEIIDYLDALHSHLHIYFSLSDLAHLHRGGRIGKATMAIGSLLKVKPIFTFESNNLVQHDKAFGNVQVINKLAALALHDHLIRPISRIYVAHGGCAEYLPQLEDKIRQTLEGDYELLRGEIGSVIAVHAGPGALGVMYY
ncbi:MAG: DegV family protein [bacterium]|nr:DegV family protein [bacterium]